ncbi:MAG: methyltransferase domain-containing protein [Chitinispirillaceae bacterium]|nr:methyltransferase domain-containing protein [Chitinispirillaceae bacterium]
MELKTFRKRLNDLFRFSPLSPVFIELQALRRTLVKARPYFKGTLVDVGCGEKPYYNLIGPFVDHYFGVEVPTTYAEVNRKVQVLTQNFILPFKPGSVDTVLLTQVLEHTYEPVRLLASIRPILKDDAYLIVTVPKSNPVHEEPYDFFRYTPFSMRRMMDDAGLETVKCEPTSTFGHMLFQTFLGWLGRKLQYSKSLRSYLLKASVIIPVVFIVNCIGWLLGLIMKDERETLDYIVIARKKLPDASEGNA